VVDRSRTARVSAALVAGARVLALVLGLGAGLGSCSLLLDLDAAQCRTDGDCARFGEATCDKARRICVARAGSANDAAAEAATDAGAVPDQGDAHADAPVCRSQGGCLPCPATAAPGLLNACTGVLCVPFDNAARLHNLTADGAIKPLP
jgi:hypothetical protein